MHYLNRHNSGLPDEIWERIDEAALNAAKDVLTGRRFLDVEGPFGVGLTAIEVGNDDYCREPLGGEAGAIVSQAISVPMLRKTCKLSIRRVEAHLTMGHPLDLSPIEDAAEAVANREEEFVYYGQKDFALLGLMTAEGRHDLPSSDWTQVEQALNDVLNAVNRLDSAGFHGPYALALSPANYNNLFRRYEGTDMLQLDHLKRLCEGGVYKAPIEGAVLVDPHAGRLIVGQDLHAGYANNDGIHYELFVSESLALLLDTPEAVCTLTPAAGG